MSTSKKKRIDPRFKLPNMPYTYPDIQRAWNFLMNEFHAEKIGLLHPLLPSVDLPQKVWSHHLGGGVRLDFAKDVKTEQLKCLTMVAWMKDDASKDRFFYTMAMMVGAIGFLDQDFSFVEEGVFLLEEMFDGVNLLTLQKNLNYGGYTFRCTGHEDPYAPILLFSAYRNSFQR
ncbi:hypothetical protein ACFYKX_11875 [Cytobacillus sp. FJAT-54145]|uniref:Uncharacterized protein n=1 Tax=Cytobacillus spartinae TaxID=3299023 RepID=A0ABW6K9S2_9BACI